MLQKRTQFVYLVLVTGLFFIAGCSSSTPTSNTITGVPAAGVVAGTITDALTFSPVAGALVTIGSKSELTKADGTFELDSVGAGINRITVARQSYNTLVDTVVVVDAVLTEYQHSLKPVFTKIAGWTQVQSGSNETLTCVTFATNTIVYAAGFAGTVLKSTDAGTTWSKVSAPYNDNLYSIHFTDASHGIVLGNAGGIFITSDGGASWSSSAAPNYALRASSWANGTAPGSFGIAVGGVNSGLNGVVIETLDGGKTWKDISNQFSSAQSLYAVAIASPTQGFAADRTGNVFQTVDGTNWNLVTNTGSSGVWFFAAAMPDAQDITFVGQDGSVLHSSSGGAQWMTAQPASELNGVTFIDAKHGLAVGSGGKILLTTDGALTWQDMTTSGTKLSQSAFSDPFHGIIVGDNGTILQSIPQ